jgi:methanogenic corrinoid protein MtbC1
MWNVGESTVKRWSDAGDLACIRTRGGHRRFTLDALLRFQETHRFESTGWLHEALVTTEPDAATDHVEMARLEAALNERDHAELRALYYEAAIVGDEQRGIELLQRAYLRGLSEIELKEQILTPVLHLIGDRWRRGELNIYEEHLASRVTIAATDHLHSRIPHRNPTGRTAVCGCPEGDLHEIALHLIVEILETEGWRVISMGPNTPLFSFADAVRHFKPDIVCISSTIIVDLERLRRDYVQFYPVTRELGTRIVIGGAAFNDPEVRGIFTHDFHGERFSDLLGYLRKEFPAS